MICKKCNEYINDEEAMVLKRGTYENKPLCKKCFDEELQKILGD